MPHQNRVTPTGEIIAVPNRGTFFGNRGLIHNPRQQIVRPFKVTRWLICLLEFKGRHRPIMAPGQYTELFFLDEATALSAGHRPCAECRRPAYDHFRRCWVATHGAPGDKLPAAGEMDDALHRDRLAPTGAKQTYEADLATLPDGTFILHNNDPWLLWRSALHHWTPGGYDQHLPRPSSGAATVLTPRVTVGTIAAGYAPAIHLSAQAAVAVDA